ncbi:hypothetical protein MBEHAL_0141 [Halarchaeum acidiphilum MH1-52-1]|uniref:Uncharacterized protein n=1 Tax=Halarchaeum acidiphilum MH1-52-1 TaxID=1261545 RepID=U2YCQ0_9EURY|nr:hypothetical protein MBEHAL_0141 [Halarchaeum acidiphilum MH1-52-1]
MRDERDRRRHRGVTTGAFITPTTGAATRITIPARRIEHANQRLTSRRTERLEGIDPRDARKRRKGSGPTPSLVT